MRLAAEFGVDVPRLVELLAEDALEPFGIGVLEMNDVSVLFLGVRCDRVR